MSETQNLNAPENSQCLLLCVNKKNFTTLAHIEVCSLDNDGFLFQNMKNMEKFEENKSGGSHYLFLHGFGRCYVKSHHICRGFHFYQVRWTFFDHSQFLANQIFTKLSQKIFFRVRALFPFFFIQITKLDSTSNQFQVILVRNEIRLKWFKIREFPPKREMDKKRYLYEPVPMEDVESADISLSRLLKPGPHTNDVWKRTFTKKLWEQLFWQPSVGNQLIIGWGILINERLNWIFILFTIIILVSVCVKVIIYATITSDTSSAFQLGVFLVELFTVYMTD